MKLIDLKLDEYLDILISDEPAPGGGSVSALACAQGAALVSMVCDLTTMKKKYADDHELCGQIKEEAVKLYADLKAAIDKDTDAYNLVAAAFKMPKETPEDKAARKRNAGSDEGSAQRHEDGNGRTASGGQTLRTFQQELRQRSGRRRHQLQDRHTGSMDECQNQSPRRQG